MSAPLVLLLNAAAKKAIRLSSSALVEKPQTSTAILESFMTSCAVGLAVEALAAHRAVKLRDSPAQHGTYSFALTRRKVKNLSAVLLLVGHTVYAVTFTNMEAAELRRIACQVISAVQHLTTAPLTFNVRLPSRATISIAPKADSIAQALSAAAILRPVSQH